MIHFLKIKISLKKEQELLQHRITLAKNNTDNLHNIIKYLLKEQKYLQMIQMHKEMETKLTSKEKHFIVTSIKMEINRIMQYLSI